MLAESRRGSQSLVAWNVVERKSDADRRRVLKRTLSESDLQRFSEIQRQLPNITDSIINRSFDKEGIRSLVAWNGVKRKSDDDRRRVLKRTLSESDLQRFSEIQRQLPNITGSIINRSFDKEGIRSLVRANGVHLPKFVCCFFFDDAFEAFSKLGVQSLSFRLCRGLTPKKLHTLSKSISLQELEIVTTQMEIVTTQEDCQWLGGIQKLFPKSLKSLSLSDFYLRYVNISWISHLPYLEKLELKGAGLLDSHLVSLYLLKKLTKLVLSDNYGITNDGVSALLKELPNLEEVNVRDCHGITHEAMVFAKEHHPKKEELNILVNRVRS